MQFTTRNGYHWRQYILEMCDYTSEVVKKRNYYLHTNITVGIKIIIKKKNGGALVHFKIIWNIF